MKQEVRFFFSNDSKYPFHPRIVGGRQQPLERVTFSPSQKGHDLNHQEHDSSLYLSPTQNLFLETGASSRAQLWSCLTFGRLGWSWGEVDCSWGTYVAIRYRCTTPGGGGWTKLIWYFCICGEHLDFCSFASLILGSVLLVYHGLSYDLDRFRLVVPVWLFSFFCTLWEQCAVEIVDIAIWCICLWKWTHPFAPLDMYHWNKKKVFTQPFPRLLGKSWTFRLCSWSLKVGQVNLDGKTLTVLPKQVGRGRRCWFATQLEM